VSDEMTATGGARRALPILVGLAALLCALLPHLLAAQCDTLSGRVRAGESYEQPFGDGLLFLLRANAQAPPNPEGWTIEVRRDGPGKGHDFVWVATPPYRWWNPRYIDTSYGVSAREAVARDVRSFGFVTSEAAYASLARAVDLLVSSRPVEMTEAEFEAARDSAHVTWQAMLERAGGGELRITGADVSDSTSELPGGRIERLAFTAVLCPAGASRSLPLP
jgi:hypothetical protein